MIFTCEDVISSHVIVISLEISFVNLIQYMYMYMYFTGAYIKSNNCFPALF